VPTRGIKHAGLSGFLSDSSRIKVHDD